MYKLPGIGPKYPRIPRNPKGDLRRSLNGIWENYCGVKEWCVPLVPLWSSNGIQGTKTVKTQREMGTRGGGRGYPPHSKWPRRGAPEEKIFGLITFPKPTNNESKPSFFFAKMETFFGTPETQFCHPGIKTTL